MMPSVAQIGSFALFAVVSALTGNTQSVMAFVGAVILHELGHLTAALILRVRITDISFTPFGIMLRFNFSGASAVKEICVCLGGSIAGLTVGLAIMNSSYGGRSLGTLATVSVTLAVLNLLPVRGLDGGSIAECLLSRMLLPDKAYSCLKMISAVTVVLFWIVTLKVEMSFGINLSMMLLSIFLLYSEL